MAGRLAGNRMRPDLDAVLLTSFPARGLPQSGSKGLSQSKASRLSTPLANAPQNCGAGWILSQGAHHCVGRGFACAWAPTQCGASLCRSGALAAIKPRRPPPIAPRAGLPQNAGHLTVLGGATSVDAAGWRLSCIARAVFHQAAARPPRHRRPVWLRGSRRG